MKITLSIDSKETIELSLSDTSNFLNWLDDNEKYAAFFSLLAEHPSSELRCIAANTSYLSLKVLKNLARDSSVVVVSAVARNKAALKQFKMPLIQEMIARDVSVAMAIAECLRYFHEEISEEVVQILLQHHDPKVIETAENFDPDRG